MDKFDADFVIVGSGFGGSVSALRLVEKGYDVIVLEKGRRFGADDFPETNWDLRRWLWLPTLGCRGIFKMNFFRHLTALTGVGVGGGSLVYANTLPIPKDSFYEASSWSHLASWKIELAPHYKTAHRMLGAQENPVLTYPDEVLRSIGDDLGRGEHFEPTTVAVHFGEQDEEVQDPYFDGAGPTRTGCKRCGGCMTGCRHNAKNTLDKNYLWLAERGGAQVHADTEVVWVRPLDGGGYEIEAREGTALFGRPTATYRAKNVIFSGGVVGTIPLLLTLKESGDGLPGLSDQLGEEVRTNSEVLMGIITERRDVDMSEGIAISSILHTDEHSHIEPVRYRDGSGFFRLLMAPHAPGSNMFLRMWNVLLTLILHPLKAVRALLVPNFGKFTTILLYMRAIDGTLRLRLGRSVFTLLRRLAISKRGTGTVPTAAIPEATDLGRRFANKTNGFPGSLFTETLLGIPTTAHILGGACMGATPQDGVIDHRHRVFGYDGLFVIDGSAVSANPGVNPSLTIAALAERAMTFIPPRSTSDGQ